MAGTGDIRSRIKNSKKSRNQERKTKAGAENNPRKKKREKREGEKGKNQKNGHGF